MLSKRSSGFLLMLKRFRALGALVQAAIGLGMSLRPTRLWTHVGSLSKGDAFTPDGHTYQVGSFLLSLA
jgi:hypothetical protein